MKALIQYTGQYPYKVLWIMAFPILIMGYLLRSRTVDIQMHDTYLVIDLCTVGILIFIYSLLCGAIYFLFRNQKFDIYLTIIHLLSIGLLFVFWIANAKIYPSLTPENFDIWMSTNKNIILGTMIFGVLQLLFLVNLVISFFRN